MMIKKLYLFLLLFGLAGLGESYGQEMPDYVLSKSRNRGGSASRIYSLMHRNDSFYYVLRTNARFTQAEFETYDPKLNFVKQSNAGLRGDMPYTGALNVLGNMYFLQLKYRHDIENDIYRDVSFVAFPLDTNTLQVKADSIILVAPFTMESNYYRGNFAISPDRTKILLYDYEEKGDIEEVSGLTNIVNLRVFDNNFNLLWKRTINLAPDAMANRVVAIKKFRVNNLGTVAVLTDIFRDGEIRTYLGKKTTADPTLFFIGREENEFLRFTPNLGNFFYNEMDFSFDRRGHIHWVGCYSRTRYYQQSGIFYLQLNANCSKVLVKTNHDFSPELIAETLEKKKPKPERELRNFKFASWRIHPTTNEVTAVLERQPPSAYNFKAHQLIVLRLDTLGQLRWATPIQKWGDLKESLETFLSHYLVVQDDATYILYNTGIYAENQAVVARINAKGEKTTKILFRYNNQFELVCPRLSYPVGDKLFICLQSQFFESYRFGLVDLARLFKD